MDSYCEALEGSNSGCMSRLSRSNNNLYFLQSFDHPGMILITNTLTETNYLQWCTTMETALSAKLKLGFVNRISPPSEHDKMYPLWLTVDRMV